MLKRLDLQFFAEEEESDNLDFDTLVAEFESEYEEDEVETEIVEDLETDDSTETVEDEVETTEESTEVVPEESKRNAAFAELRRQAEANSQYASFVQQLAESAGITPEEVLQRFEDKKLEEEAVKQEVPVDVLKRLQALETENYTVKEQMTASRFNAEAAETAKKYEATEDDMRAVFEYSVQNGIDLASGTVPFETVYRMTHMDSIIQKEVEKSKQTSLENKRKRQTSATLPIGASESTGSDEITDDFVDAELKRMGLDNRL